MKTSFASLVLVVSLFLAAPLFAAALETESVGDYGTIDWIGQRVTARGVGAPPPEATNTAQARAMAQRAALVVARRNLLEVVKGVRIDSATTVANFMVQNDLVVSKVQGVLLNSAIEGYEYFSDGSVEAVVSMPLTGELGEVLMPLALESSVPVPPATDIEARLDALEQRVETLERRLASARQASLDQRRLLELFMDVAAAWAEQAASGRLVAASATASAADIEELRARLISQQNQIHAIEGRLAALSAQVATRETAPAARAAQQAKQPEAPPYTGLVVDARAVDFKPCLRPTIAAAGVELYPGRAIDHKRVISKGFVRYFSSPVQAEQSEQAGSLPYSAKAVSTGVTQSELLVDDADATIIRTVQEAPDNFLRRARVAIVF